MKSARSYSQLATAAALALAVATHVCHATSYQWDTNNSDVGLGGNGSWDETAEFWDLLGFETDDGTDITQPVVFSAADTAVFGGTSGTVTLDGAVTPNAITFNTAGYTISGTGSITPGGSNPVLTANADAAINVLLAGTTAFAKTGTGTLTLSATNTFTGQLSVLQGSLAVGTVNNASADGPLGNSASAVVLGSTGNTGTLSYTGATATSSKTFSLATGGTGAIDVTTGASTLTLSAAISGAGGLSKTGAGGLTLTGANTFSGQLVVANGLMSLNVGAGATTVAASTGNLGNASSITIESGATLHFLRSATGSNTSGANSIGTNSKVITVNSGGVLKTSTYNPFGYYNQNQMANVVLSGGTLDIASEWAYINSITLNAGGSVISSGASGAVALWYVPAAAITANADVTFAARIHINGNVGNQTFSVAPDKTLTISGNISNFNNTTAGTGNATSNGFIKSGTGNLVLSGTNNYGGVTSVSAGTVKLGNASGLGATSQGTSVTAGAVLDLNGQTVGAEALTLNGTGIASGGVLINSSVTAASLGGAVTLASNSSVTTTGNITLGGVVGGPASSLTKSGNGTLTLSNAANTYGGGTTVNAGILAIGGNGSLGSGALSFTAVGTGLTINGTAVTLANNISLPTTGTGNVTLLTPNNSATVLNGPLSGGAVGVTLFFQGGASGQTSGALTLNADNSGLLGTINVQRGPLILGNANGAGSTMILLDSNNNANGALQLAGNFTIANNVKINYQSQRIGVGVGLSAGISGVVSENSANGMEKVGTGTLTLSNTNTYTGGTTVSAGTLVVTGSLAATGAVVVNNANSTLAGTGTIGGGTTVATGAIIAPGVAGIGTLNFSNNLTMDAGANLAVDVTGATTCDKIVLAAGKTIATNGTITITPVGHTFAAGDSYDIVDVGAGGAITGTPAIVPATPGAGLEWDITTFTTTGVIGVKAAGGYSAWASANAPTGTATDDFDNDGVPNGLEFVLGGTKDTNDLAKLPVTATDGTDMTFTFIRDMASISPGTALAIQVDSDMIDWPTGGLDYFPVADAAVSANPGVTVQDDVPEAGKQTITLTVPMAPDSAKFARLLVTITPP